MGWGLRKLTLVRSQDLLPTSAGSIGLAGDIRAQPQSRECSSPFGKVKISTGVADRETRILVASTLGVLNRTERCGLCHSTAIASMQPESISVVPFFA